MGIGLFIQTEKPGILTHDVGQVCAASSRLYLHESIMDEFLEKLKKSFSGVASGIGGDPQAVNSTYGPLVDRAQYDKVSAYIKGGSKGSSIVKAGPDYDGNGFYMSPVLLINPETDAPAYKEEIFGPVLCVRSFKTEDEALRLANDTTYGLAGLSNRAAHHLESWLLKHAQDRFIQKMLAAPSVSVPRCRQAAYVSTAPSWWARKLRPVASR